MDIHPLGNVHDQLYISVIVVVCAAGNLNVVVCHPDVVCVGVKILGGGHHGELNGALVAECFVGPFSDGADLLNGGDSVVCNQDLFREKGRMVSVCPVKCPNASLGANSSEGREAYVCDNCVAVVGSDEVLHLGRRRVGKAVATDEVVGKVVLLRVRCLTIGLRYYALAIGSASCVGHVCGCVKGCDREERTEEVSSGGP